MKKATFLLAIITIMGMSPVFADHHAAPDSGPSVHQEQHTENHDAEHHDSHHHAPHIDGCSISLFWVIPFVGILLSIALMPLISPHFWEHNYGKISLFWGASFFIAFTIGFGANTSFFYLTEVYLDEFIPFIALLLALFTVAGGVHLRGRLVGTPILNTIIILIGTALASWMGTTGAAMLLIRPLIRANEWRKYKTHVVVFFIILVANVGGSLTPLGDPPLFLGFLKGVDFFWTTTHMLPIMLTAVGILSVAFFALDSYYYYKIEPNKKALYPDEERRISLEGKRNLLLLPAIVGAVLLSSKDLGPAFTLMHYTLPLAKLLQVLALLGITGISLYITESDVRKSNEFTWEPILEVAKLFATIFITMVPPIAMLKAGTDGPLGYVVSMVRDDSGNFINTAFFWVTGILSSFLDNAPTYLVFFSTTNLDAAALMGEFSQTLLAISAGAVFMGANTYIGNAPNFMVKSIAEESGVWMPSFFGYIIKFSIPILLPTFFILSLIFF